MLLTFVTVVFVILKCSNLSPKFVGICSAMLHWYLLFFSRWGEGRGANFESCHCRYHYRECDGVMFVFTPVVVIGFNPNTVKRFVL